MMRGGAPRRSILLVALMAVAAPGCVIGTQRMIGTGDLIFDRQRLGRVQEEQLGEIQSKFKAGNIPGIAVRNLRAGLTRGRVDFVEGLAADRRDMLAVDEVGDVPHEETPLLLFGRSHCCPETLEEVYTIHAKDSQGLSHPTSDPRKDGVFSCSGDG